MKKLRENGDIIEGFPKLISHKETENSAEFIINVSKLYCLTFNFLMTGPRTKHTEIDATVSTAKVQHAYLLQNSLQAGKLVYFNLW